MSTSLVFSMVRFEFAGGAAREFVGGHADDERAFGDVDGLVAGKLDEFAFVRGDLDADLGLRGARQVGVTADDDGDEPGLVGGQRDGLGLVVLELRPLPC